MYLLYLYKSLAPDKSPYCTALASNIEIRVAFQSFHQGVRCNVAAFSNPVKNDSLAPPLFSGCKSGKILPQWHERFHNNLQFYDLAYYSSVIEHNIRAPA